jgi:DNA-binding Xre family transcriptional regulator
MTKVLSTFEREMKDPAFEAAFEDSYQELLLSELIIEMMEKNHKSVRTLAKAVGLSPTVIQNLRSGKQEDIKMSNFINISHACGYQIVLEKNKERIPL